MTRDELMECVSYDPETGIFTRLKSARTRLIGKPITRKDSNGYIQAFVMGKLRMGHVMAWLIHYGSMPENQVDHINGIRDDNRICNLRQATHSQNMMNRVTAKRSRSGYKGVAYHNQTGGYRAVIMKDGVSHSLGLYKTAREAYIVYCLEAMEMFGDYARFS
jgi:hypothetical protein